MQWDDRLTQLGLTVEPADRTQRHWALTAAWLTVAGDWATAPDWAKQGWWGWGQLGGDHHAYGICRDLAGNVPSGAGFVLTWPGGGDMRKPTDCGTVDWANLPLDAGYNWQGMSGPYAWAKFGNADVLTGLGLPYPPLPWQPQQVHALGGVHVSFFGVWEEREPGQEPEPEQPGCLPSLWRHLLTWWRER